MDDLPIVVVGPGALGGLIAATLVHSGRRVALLCRGPKQAAALRRSGLTVSGASELHIPGRDFFAVSSRATDLAPASAVIFCVKAYALPAALRAGRPLLKKTAAAVCVQNGVLHAAAFKKAAGPCAVIGAAYVAAVRTAAGTLIHAGGKRFLFDENADAGALLLTQTLLRGAGWETATAPLEALLWTKTALNASINTLGAVSGSLNGGLAENPPLKDLLERAAAEAEAVLRAGGIQPTETPLSAAAVRLCAASAANANSTLADLRAGRRTELDAIAGPLLKLAKKHKVQTPVLGALARWTRALERGRP